MAKRRPTSPSIPRPTGPILVVGDIMCDHYLWGEVERISPEAPVQVLRWEREANRPGGAANAAMNLAALGCKVHLVGVVGEDDAGRWLIEALRRSHIDTTGVLVSKTRPTTSKTRIIARGQHMLRVDRESREDLDPADERRLTAAIGRMKRVSGILCSDYAKGVLSDRVLAAGLSAKRGSPLVIDPKARDFSKYRGADLLTPNEKEFTEALGPAANDIHEKAKSLLRHLNLNAMLVTRGANGMDLFEVNKESVRRTHIPVSQRQEVFDVTGAGDTVAAVVTMGAAAGLTFAAAARLASIAAGIVVGIVGTAVVDAQTLARAIARDGRGAFH
jgi:D-beta-D-heptose 7-phosphate kinase / D-beta-D-heptose 1-phosphate adenosyltransferase